ncbi:MAG: LysM domain-containing protein [Eubacteriales bacterium]|nr:LysM domain-containing protein [Eubacteriales bacterium]
MDRNESFDFSKLSHEELAAISGGGNAPQLVRHTVQQGETLDRIAEMYHSTVVVILILNKLSDASAIYPGMNLWVPIIW